LLRLTASLIVNQLKLDDPILLVVQVHKSETPEVGTAAIGVYSGLLRY
jgi:hypothetical protein